MTEQELMAQFEREVTDEFNGENNTVFTYYECFQMWKRAKTEVRNVRFDKNGVGDTNMYMVSDALEQINVKVEFV